MKDASTTDLGSPGPANYHPFPAFSDWIDATIDTSDFDRYAELFRKTKAGASDESLIKAIDTANRYAAVDTNAIEGLYETDRGFTRTIATQAAAWESVIDSRGPVVKQAFQDALNGYEYVLDAVTRRVDISEVWIRQLHEILCATQDEYTVHTVNGPERRPLPKGTYKTIPNSPTLLDGRVHAYASVLDTPSEMQRFVKELRTVFFMNAHSVLQATYAHYAYVCVHPFADGNGRVARALASVFTYRSPGVPLVIFADQRNEYFDALEAADRENVHPFVRFIAARTIDTVGIIRLALQNSDSSVTESMTSIKALFRADEYTEELQAAVNRLRVLAVSETTQQIAALELPSNLTMNVVPGILLATLTTPTGYLPVGAEGSITIHARSAYPVSVDLLVHFAVFRRGTRSGVSDLLLASNSDNGLEVWLRELIPIQTETARMKIHAWIEGRIGEILASVTQLARDQQP